MAHTYDLLVEIEEKHVPGLKNKLVKYFQSKKSNGGDCEIEYENGSRTAVLHFRRQEDQKNVLAKESHQIHLDKDVLRLTVRLLTDEAAKQEASSGKVTKKSAEVNSKQPPTAECLPAAEIQEKAEGGDATADEDPCSTSAVIGNIPDTLRQEFLEMLVENILRNSTSVCQDYTFEYIPAISSIVVTFQSGKEATEFITSCPKNTRFTKMGLSVRLLEVTDQLMAEDLQNINEDLLTLSLESAGVEVENIVFNEVEQSAIITFNDHKAVEKILKRKNSVAGREIKLFAFHKSLGTALYGKNKPSLRLPAAVCEPVDHGVWTYLKGSKPATEDIRSLLSEHHCTVDLSQSTVCLSPVSSLLQRKDARAIVKTWKDTVKSAFARSISKFKSIKFQPELEVWEESEEKIRQTLLNEDVVVVPDKGNGVISVAGLVDVVNRLEQPLSEVIKKIDRKLQRQKLSVTQVIRISPSIYRIMCLDGLRDKLRCVYPELEMTHKNDSPELIVTGLKEEIMATSNSIYAKMLELKRQNLDMDHFLLELLKDEQKEELTNVLLRSYGINAAFEIGAHRVQLLAAHDKDLKDAEDHLGKMLISEYIEVEDSNVLKKPEWEHLLGQLESANNKPCNRIRIRNADEKVVVSGNKDRVVKVSSEISGFLTQNAQLEETVVIKPNVIVEFIKNLGTSRLDETRDKVVVSFKKEAICLSGARVDVNRAKSLINDLVSSVFFEHFKISVPGAKKFFKSHEAMTMSSLQSETYLAKLVDDTADGQGNLACVQVPKPVYQFQTSDGVEIAICRADMCSYSVHAVVNAATPDLKHVGGLAKALLNAAGPLLQVECDKLINLNGLLKPGDCVITPAGGQLRCKKVIHAVAPRFDSTKSQKGVEQLKRAVKGSLYLAEKNNCVSVALPAISRNFGFPLKSCTVAIVEAVWEYCHEKYEDTLIKRIHFVDNDDSTIQALEAAVKEKFGTSQSPSGSKEPSHSTSSPSDPNCLGQVQTKEGVDIILIKGNIEDAMTDVTVNTVFEDLALNKGAVSKAILRMAGPKLQDMIKAEKGRGTFGEVIVTEGFQLKSMFVYHVVTPGWDKGQGNAQKTLSGIFRDCLNKAEQNCLTSISFPAIGTGNLCYPKDLVAQMLFDEILAFSSAKPKYLQKVMIRLYPGDTQTLQVFTDEFKKRFSNVTGVAVPVSSASFSKVVSSAGMYETKMGSVAIQAVTGDITKETTDVIVNSSNDNFSLKSGVSKAILNAAGQAVEDECHKLGAEPNAGTIMTQAGNLKCKKIIHVVGQSNAAHITKVVKDALQMCLKNSYTSISFPAIGTGQGSVDAKQVADAMLDAVIDVLSSNSSTTLNNVRIVIFQPPMLKDFYNSMCQREVPAPKAPSIFTKLREFFTGGADKPQKDEEFVIEALKVDPVYFHICGKSQASVDAAKQKINELFSKEHTRHNFTEKASLSFSEAERQRITEIQKTWSVSIMAKNKQGEISFTIEGLSSDVFKATIEINEMLRKARDEEDLKVKVELAGRVAAWQYMKGSQFENFDSMTNYELEQALVKNLPSVKVTIQGQLYTVQMPNGPATDNQGHALQIRRNDNLKDEDFPTHWDTMPANTQCHVVTLMAGTAEYTQVQNQFNATCGRTITKIDRIQNLGLWKSLQIKKHDMEHRNGHQNNEKLLFHGTCEDIVATINEHGFNRSYAGKNAAHYGNGTYFAIQAKYSAQDTYSRPNQNGEKHMYLCRVLTGDYTLGKSGMIVPPSKTANSVSLFDSVVDNVTNPSLFVVFHDNQAYPEYLIKFQ